MIVDIVEGIDLDTRPSARLLRQMLRAAALDGRVVRTAGQLRLLTVGQVAIVRTFGQHGRAGGTFAQSVLFLLADLLPTDIDPDATVKVEVPVCHRVDDQLVGLVRVGHDGDTGVVIRVTGLVSRDHIVMGGRMSVWRHSLD